MYTDLPNTQGGYSGTLEIVRRLFRYLQLTVTDWLQWGSPISDITTAAGWEIMDCDQNAVEQDIRLVCTSSAAACGHLYSSGGAEGKIVRLPESVSHILRSFTQLQQIEPSAVRKKRVCSCSQSLGIR